MNARNTQNGLGRIRRMLAAAVLGIGAMGAGEAQARLNLDIDVQFSNARYSTLPRYEMRETRVWVEPIYRTEYDRVWVDPVYRDVTERIWIDPVYREERQQVWVEPVYELRPVIRWEGGRRVELSVRVCVQEGRWDTSIRRVLVCSGRWELRTTRVLVSAGYWQTVTRQVCVRAGYWDTRYERVAVDNRILVPVPRYEPPHRTYPQPAPHRGGTIRDADGDRFVADRGRLVQVDRGDRYR